MRAAARRTEGGFALLFLMVALAGAGGVLALMIGRGTAMRGDLASQAEANLALVRRCAALSFTQNGAFPANLDALATQLGLDAAGLWRLDPFSAGQDLRWNLAGTPQTLTVRSVGPDGLNGTADDLLFALANQTMGRERSRNNLRISRAALLRSPYRNSGTTTPADRANLRTWQRQYSVARRQFVYATAPQQAALTAQMTLMQDNITNLCAARSCTPMPGSPAAIMAGIGRPGMTTDGFGQPLVANTAVGVVSRGGDFNGGTADDI